jgi:hypothetical protein
MQHGFLTKKLKTEGRGEMKDKRKLTYQKMAKQQITTTNHKK